MKTALCRVFIRVEWARLIWFHGILHHRIRHGSNVGKKFHRIMVAVSSNNIFIFLFFVLIFPCFGWNLAMWQGWLGSDDNSNFCCARYGCRGLTAFEVIYFHSFNFSVPFHSLNVQNVSKAIKQGNQQPVIRLEGNAKQQRKTEEIHNKHRTPPPNRAKPTK